MKTQLLLLPVAKPDLYWWDAINKLERKELRFTELLRYQRAAKNWVTCACGTQDPRIPRTKVNGCPTDNYLEALGIQFNDHWVRAEYQFSWRHLELAAGMRLTLIAIEKRSGEILSKLEEIA